ncbi:DUF1622 domain-containing protein [Actinosynnema sp. NPDC023658]|uniref:DUF1622 domain-containing protein n=1 Tax=Actinosynnema sp. NPDC023658 TaxID=3155465 RepID=UPI00340FF5D5
MGEETLKAVIDVVVTVVEAAGAGVILIGALLAVGRFVVQGLRHRDAAVFTPIRLSLSRFLVLGLEFQLAADILRSAMAPSFAEIGQLAAIAAIRTALNYFLNREITEEQREVHPTGTPDARPGARDDRPGAPDAA